MLNKHELFGSNNVTVQDLGIEGNSVHCLKWDMRSASEKFYDFVIENEKKRYASSQTYVSDVLRIAMEHGYIIGIDYS
jgi:hypothetical protein